MTDPSRLESPEMAEAKKALVADFEHAHKNNAPVTHSMLERLKALLPHGAPNETPNPG